MEEENYENVGTGVQVATAIPALLIVSIQIILIGSLVVGFIVALAG